MAEPTEAKQPQTKYAWIFGPSGCGKTLYVAQKYKDKACWVQKTHVECPAAALEYECAREDRVLVLDDFAGFRVLGPSPGLGGWSKLGAAKEFVVISNKEPNVVLRRYWSASDPVIRAMTFWRARTINNHELRLQQVAWKNAKWVPIGDEVCRTVEYDDKEPSEDI